MSILKPPVTYTVTLDVAGQTATRQLEVRKDPSSTGSIADIRAQTALLEELRAEQERTAAAINRIEWVRRQLQDLVQILEDQGGAADLVEQARALEQQFIGVEEDLTQLRSTGTGQDAVRYPAKLLEKLGHLSGGVATADFRPTDQQGEVNAVLLQILVTSEGALQDLVDGDLARLNRLLRDRGLNPLISQQP
jgi:hypothetical protein